MPRRLLAFGFGLLAALAALAAVFLTGMRTQNPAVVDAVRRMNRSVLNPRQMRSAGSPGAYAAVIRHRGRRTGRTYETPVAALPAPDGFVIALVYGTRTDWLRNVLTSGSATLVHEGRSHEVKDPQVVPTESVAHLFSAADRRGQRLFGVASCLRLRTANEGGGGTR